VPGVIGPYHLLRLLGEGGMGLVYLAEQREPLVRRVVLKLIKPGMDTREVLARFEAERQAGRSWTIRVSPGCSTPASGPATGIAESR